MKHPESILRTRRPLTLLLLAGLPLLGGLLLLGACAEPPVPVGELAFELSAEELPYPEWRSLRLAWTPQRALEATPLVFVHLLDGKGEVVRTFDHPLPAAWKPGEEQSYEVTLYQSVLAAPLPPGDYALTAGLYAAGGLRWALTTEAEEVDDGEYRLATLTVPPLGGDLPLFTFSDGWGQAEAGQDRQVLARRWLELEGDLTVSGLGVPGSLWLRLEIPRADGQRLRLVAAEGVQPSLDVTSSCSGVAESLPAAGRHELVVPVFGTETAAECTVRFSADYHLLEAGSLRRLSASLEILAWEPAVL